MVHEEMCRPSLTRLFLFSAIILCITNNQCGLSATSCSSLQSTNVPKMIWHLGLKAKKTHALSEQKEVTYQKQAAYFSHQVPKTERWKHKLFPKAWSDQLLWLLMGLYWWWIWLNNCHWGKKSLNGNSLEFSADIWVWLLWSSNLQPRC